MDNPRPRQIPVDGAENFSTALPTHKTASQICLGYQIPFRACKTKISLCTHNPRGQKPITRAARRSGGLAAPREEASHPDGANRVERYALKQTGLAGHKAHGLRQSELGFEATARISHLRRTASSIPATISAMRASSMRRNFSMNLRRVAFSSTGLPSSSV